MARLSLELHAEERIPGDGRHGGTDKLFLFEAFERDGWIDVCDEGLRRVESHTDPVVGVVLEVLAKAHALGKAAVDERGVLALTTRFDGWLLKHDVIVLCCRNELLAFKGHGRR